MHESSAAKSGAQKLMVEIRVTPSTFFGPASFDLFLQGFCTGSPEFVTPRIPIH